MKHLILEPGNNPNTRGLFSFVNQYLAACLHFKDNNNIHISFDLIRKSGYYDSSINHTENAWEYFFITKNAEYSETERTVWGDFGNFYGYEFDFNNKENRIISEEIIKKYLLPNIEINNKIEEFYNKNFKNKKILGIHKRGTDIGLHHDVKSLNIYFDEVDNIIKNYDAIFISTDERLVIDEFVARYGNVIFNSYESLSTNPNLPNFLQHTTNGYKMGEDAIIDAFLLSKTDYLIQTNSNLSNFALLANSNLEYKRII